MEKENIKLEIKEFVQNEILGRINFIYYKDHPEKRALKELGIFDKDIEIIAQKIELNNLSLSELQLSLKTHYDEYKKEISYVSNYIIRRMI